MAKLTTAAAVVRGPLHDSFKAVGSIPVRSVETALASAPAWRVESKARRPPYGLDQLTCLPSTSRGSARMRGREPSSLRSGSAVYCAR